MKTRFHGDLHLGQVLVAKDDFVIVDFEGEPMRPPERRRQKACVLRDVAGMLRSFSHAAHAAGLRVDAARGMARALADWERDATRHFLDGYTKAAAGLASVPADKRELNALLELFLIEKAACELRLAAHRPEGVDIALHGLLDLVKP